MDRDQKFWICLWGMGLVFFLSLIVSGTVNSFDRRDKWDKAVSNGADPMVTTCALYGADTHGETAICTILAQNRK
jgi:hypothetical protein